MSARASAHEMFVAVSQSGEEELDRSSTALALSGLAAGLNIGFSFIAVAAVHAAAPPEYRTILGALAYPVGFLIVIIARSQLFTENTVMPVALMLSSPSARNIGGTLRIWLIVLLANLAGAAIFAHAVSIPDVLPNIDRGALLEVAHHAYRGEWGDLFIRGIFGGWLIALVAWMLHARVSVAGMILLIWVGTSVISMAGFSHSIAGAVEVLYLAAAGEISYVDWLTRFQVPVTLGNAVGGVVLVSLINFVQVTADVPDKKLLAEAEANGKAAVMVTTSVKETGI